MEDYNVSVDQLIVVCDDLDQSIGRFKIKKGGWDNGHWGLRSIDSYIGSDYVRVKIGIGRP